MRNLVFTDERNVELVSMIKNHKTKSDAFREFAKKYNISFSWVKLHFYKNIFSSEFNKTLAQKRKPTAKKTVPADQKTAPTQNICIIVETLLKEAEKRNCPLTKEDIEDVARETGIHYHTALAIWGNMVKRGNAVNVQTEPAQVNQPADVTTVEYVLPLYTEIEALKSELAEVRRKMLAVKKLNETMLKMLYNKNQRSFRVASAGCTCAQPENTLKEIAVN